MNPTLGCSIEISRDTIYICVCVSMSVVYQNAAELRGRILKVSFGRLKLTCDTHVIHFNYMLEQL